MTVDKSDERERERETMQIAAANFFLSANPKVIYPFLSASICVSLTIPDQLSVNHKSMEFSSLLLLYVN